MKKTKKYLHLLLCVVLLLLVFSCSNKKKKLYYAEGGYTEYQECISGEWKTTLVINQYIGPHYKVPFKPFYVDIISCFKTSRYKDLSFIRKLIGVDHDSTSVNRSIINPGDSIKLSDNMSVVRRISDIDDCGHETYLWDLDYVGYFDKENVFHKDN